MVHIQKYLFACVLFLSATHVSLGQKKTLILPGETFSVSDRPAFVLLPDESKRSSPQPWIIYAPTLPAYPDQHEKWMHEQFLNAGIAVAGIDVGEGYGSPKSNQLFTSLYDELVNKKGFAPKPCLFGRSRGGLWVTSWAIENPTKVSGIIGIYPVFDFRTYPGIDKTAPAYGLNKTELESKLSLLNPISKVGVLAKSKIPVALIHGDVDKVVPLKENSQEFFNQYKLENQQDLVKLIILKGQGHNFFEGFFKSQELVDFAINRAKNGIK
ncbi:MAG: alpha/beta hydrolase [Planctomycetes bacterium]|nr:alpha/beta hydrolase [Planctomycetota bacterium]